jgi:hypothetical protein
VLLGVVTAGRAAGTFLRGETQSTAKCVSPVMLERGVRKLYERFRNMHCVGIVPLVRASSSGLLHNSCAKDKARIGPPTTLKALSTCREACHSKWQCRHCNTLAGGCWGSYPTMRAIDVVVRHSTVVRAIVGLRLPLASLGSRRYWSNAGR